MRIWRRAAATISFALAIAPSTWASGSPAEPETHITSGLAESLLAIGSAIRQTSLDCSHFVHYVFNHVGVDYDYAPSVSLYKGMSPFRRVVQPRAGDLIVWRGHVGIVVDPEQTTFLSKLRTGVKTASYQSRYWKMKGRPRFFRYQVNAGPVLQARGPGVTRDGNPGQE
jgi:cell wall-associated NlpC family hydrolase